MYDIGRDRATVDKGGLRDFIRLAWPLVEPSREYRHNWHIDAICDHLEAVSSGQIRNLVLNVPPGSTKSLSVSVFWPMWDWIKNPGLRWIYASFDLKLQRRDGKRCLDMLQSVWFRERWPGLTLPERDPPVLNIVNSAAGWRYGTSVRGTVTGNHGDRLVVDDPVKPLEVTKIGLDRCLEWWDGTMSTRQADARTTARVIMMQRLHESDLAGAMIERGGYEVLRLPMRYEKANPCVTVLGMPDPRTEDGELLDPARAPEEEVKKLEEQLGPQGSAAQLQQRPTPASGGIFAKEWLENTYIDLPPAGVIDQWCMSVDCTFKRTDTSDFVCISVWARQGTKFYLADLVNERLSFTETLAAIERMSRKWPMCLTKLVEDAANGPAVVDVLAEDVLGLELVPPRGGKVARAHAVTPLFRTGRVLLPHDAPWVKVYKSQMSLFPFGANDDMVDSTSQGLSWMFANLSHLESAMAAVRKARGK